MYLTPGVLPFNYSRPPKGRTVDDMTEEAQYLRQGVKIGNKFKTCMSLMRILLLEDVQRACTFFQKTSRHEFKFSAENKGRIR